VADIVIIKNEIQTDEVNLICRWHMTWTLGRRAPSSNSLSLSLTPNHDKRCQLQLRFWVI
jgi:hypothetical protein